MTLTPEQMIAICNDINTAVAKGKVVMTDAARIRGAFPCEKDVCVIPHGNSGYSVPLMWLDNRTIKMSKQTATDSLDMEVLYEPPAADKASASEQKPASASKTSTSNG
jgi:hypothetical protein